jgi:hypothetical protein
VTSGSNDNEAVGADVTKTAKLTNCDKTSESILLKRVELSILMHNGASTTKNSASERPEATFCNRLQN